MKAQARTVFLGLGSNLGDSQKTLREAIAELSALPGMEMVAVSSVYRTAPVGFLEQPDFLNMAAAFAYAGTPESLLEGCMAVERAHGRVRAIKNGPRTLDVDVLFFEGETRDAPALQLPHPRALERAFVRVPLREILEKNDPRTAFLKAALAEAPADAPGADGITRLGPL